ncbi:MAG: helix-turn-helix domain-containing protein [Bdellovibrionaceae bacterium]|nr:helix-turn-helix domain-containing protein [Pseudobdellovibrionaceae bacterium]
MRNDALSKSKRTKGSQSQAEKSSIWHKKIAESRGEKWLKSVARGRRDAALNPSVIRLARMNRDMRQKTMAQKLNISEASFCAIERGRQSVKESMAIRISEILGFKLGALFKRDGEKFVAVIRKHSI